MFHKCSHVLNDSILPIRIICLFYLFIVFSYKINKVYALMIGCLTRFESFFGWMTLKWVFFMLKWRRCKTAATPFWKKNEDALVKNSESAKYRFLIGRHHHDNLIYIKNVLNIYYYKSFCLCYFKGAEFWIKNSRESILILNHFRRNLYYIVYID